MNITHRDKLNIGRFGCTLPSKQNVILISWGPARHKEAVSADIVVRFIYSQCPSGPLLCLAAQISTTKAVSQTCFFPFDLNTRQHRKYIDSILKKRKIEFWLLSDWRRAVRLYEIPIQQVKNASELYAVAVSDLTKFPKRQYDFDRAVAEFEQSARTSEAFECVVSSKELSNLVISIRNQAEKIATEDRLRAANLAKRLVDVFGLRYEKFIREQIKQLPSYRRAFLFLSDLQREFGGNYPAFVEFVSDIFAAQSGEKELRELESAVIVLESILSLVDQMKQAPEGNEESRLKLIAEFQQIVSRMVGGQGLSLDSLKGFLSILGFPVGGRPGRTPKDYSAEYALKAAGSTWRAVAEHTLKNDSETRLEFGQREYEALSWEEKDTLKNRIREGVRSYAKRTSKSFPPQKESKSEVLMTSSTAE
jgi:hypothetical protein